MTAVRLHLARSLRGKLVSLFVAAGLVPLCVVGVISYRQAAGELHRSAGARLADVAFNATDKIDRNLFERYGDVQAFAKSDAARSLEPSRLSRWMDTMMATYTPIYQLMVVADTTGNVIAANSVGADGRPLDTSSLSGLNVATRELVPAGDRRPASGRRDARRGSAPRPADGEGLRRWRALLRDELHVSDPRRRRADHRRLDESLQLVCGRGHPRGRCGPCPGARHADARPHARQPAWHSPLRWQARGRARPLGGRVTRRSAGSALRRERLRGERASAQE